MAADTSDFPGERARLPLTNGEDVKMAEEKPAPHYALSANETEE